MALRTRMEGLGLDRRAAVSRLCVALCLLGGCGIWLGLASAAHAGGASLTWAGGTAGDTMSAAEWSNAANWAGGEAPEAGQELETLTFPHLGGSECASEPPTDTCYATFNDLSDLNVESLQLDDGDDYLLAGDGITLGRGGLTAVPPATGGEAGAFVFMPLTLSGSQSWSIANRSGGRLRENGVLLGEPLSGDTANLNIEMHGGPALVLANETEVGPLTITGANSTGQYISNGSVVLAGEELNSGDRQPVDLSHVFFEGTGAVGGLDASDSSIAVGSRSTPAEALTAASVKLNGESGVFFEITGSGTTPQVDYSQLVSQGPVELAGVILVTVAKPSPEAPCPTLEPGRKYTFLSTPDELTGSFENAPGDGPEIKIDFAESCDRAPQTMRIEYSRTGGVETVTGTVEAQVVEQHEKEVREQEAHEKAVNERAEKEASERKANEKVVQEQETKKREEALTDLAEEHARKATEEALQGAARKHEEEARKHEEESLAHQGVLASKEQKSTPTPPARAELLAKGLKVCRKQPRKKRTRCEAAVRRKYGAKGRRKKGGKR